MPRFAGIATYSAALAWTMLKIGFNLNRLSTLFGGQFRPLLDVARRADEQGIDQIVIGDHLALIPDGYGSYPYGRFPNESRAPMAEAMTMLSAVAGVTQRARLSMNVLIAPLRPALLLAKELAMLDVLSNGRVDAALGAGWLREEFEAAERPYEGRFTYMEEQVEACRVLWADAPASYNGKRVKFRNVYLLPHPVQGARLPIWFGLGATERNVERIARLADGWAAPPGSDEEIAAGISLVHLALRERGRDVDSFPIRATLRPIFRDDGSVDFDRCRGSAARLKGMGVTMLNVLANLYCSTPSDIDPFMDWLLTLRKI